MSQLAEALNDVVQANIRRRMYEDSDFLNANENDASARELAQASDRYEAAVRDAMEQAVRDHLARMQHLPADLYEALNYPHD